MLMRILCSLLTQEEWDENNLWNAPEALSDCMLSTFVCTHCHCWFCVSSAPVVRSAILRFFSHGVFSVKFLCAPVSVCLKGP